MLTEIGQRIFSKTSSNTLITFYLKISCVGLNFSVKILYRGQKSNQGEGEIMNDSERIKLIKRLLNEAENYLAKGDSIQSSEKLYKVAEECIKALAERFNLEEVKAAEEKGRWTVTLLEKAVGKLINKLGMDIGVGWDAANYLHVWGFHEAKLDVEAVKRREPMIKRLVELTGK